MMRNRFVKCFLVLIGQTRFLQRQQNDVLEDRRTVNALWESSPAIQARNRTGCMGKSLGLMGYEPRLRLELGDPTAGREIPHAIVEQFLGDLQSGG